MRIKFEDLDLSVAGVPVAPLRGSFDLDSDGEIWVLTLESWKDEHSTLRISAESQGVPRVLWHLICPVIQTVCADQIAEAVEKMRPRRPCPIAARHSREVSMGIGS
jgi:hypothetical protein